MGNIIMMAVIAIKNIVNLIIGLNVSFQDEAIDLPGFRRRCGAARAVDCTLSNFPRPFLCLLVENHRL